ncbi:Alkaline phosphatase protein [Alloalcanivorax dieselolei B5]|uniref:Alkaline phosphatase protein n=1 Tax=Alcanivorax dieselolei (strain DSM 16502 / CGMCC 1.3690 / MCCC 1A00001 / B-5) TaxID=930169 RepID=K0C910_ALCDB|nr:alkaline phosphatase [Alloalcanivorax dieselolei]AFT69068.1 Alkaline phosphatase protein [Alloalcanivorax dieselolei B5]GGJ82311.1 alkaline phosphatase [Alloalcanivorax dieselolei]
MKRSVIGGALICCAATLMTQPVNAAQAKNIIFFLGDGMGPVTQTAARIYAGEKAGLEVPETHKLAMEQLDYAARIKTYSEDAQTTDSAPGMASYMTGMKSKNEVISMTPDTNPNDGDGNPYQTNGDSLCPETGNGEAARTLLEILKAEGYSTGVVTTTRITHATPATTYAHICNRNAENTIATQMVPGGEGYNSALGNDGIDVILGGGRRHFLPAPDGRRSDDRDLIMEMQGAGYTYVSSGSELGAVDLGNTEKLFGLFNSSDLNYELDRVNNELDEPSLAEMTRSAIDILSRNQDGYFLMVEGGRIDHALHGTNAKRALEDTLAFDQAIAAAMEKADLENTLIIVTADHDHVMAFNGYSKIGNPVLGLLKEYRTGGLALDAQGKPFTTLVFGNGGGPREADRATLTEDEVLQDDYLQEVGVKLGGPGSETHGGGDVRLNAGGAGSDLFKGTLDNVDVFGLIHEAMGL